MKILAIDDNPDNITVLRAVVSERLPDAVFLSAPDGPKGIDLARAQDPDVILLDVVMPHMDGYEVCRMLKADALLQPIPVIFVTAQNDRDTHIRALEAGADAFLSKPFDEIELTVQVRIMAKIKAAAVLKRDDAARLADLVEERTRELQKSQTAMLNLLEDLRAEVAARQASEFRVRAITDSAQDAILMMDPEGLITYWNPAAGRIFGYSSDEALGRELHALIAPPRYHAAHRSAFPAFLETGKGGAIGKVLDMEALHKDGREMAIQLSLSAIQIDGAWHSVGIIRDVSAHRLEELELKKLRAAVEQSANTIVITDSRGTIEYVNPAFEKASGYTAAEAIGQNPRLLKSGNQDAGFYKNLWETITAKKIWRGEFHNKHKDGTLYWELATISPVVDDKEKIVHYVAVKEDITDRKEMEGRLAEALTRAETAARTKSDFLAVMSHELRTPLNGVLGFAEILTYSRLDKEQKECVRTITSSGEHLLAVVNDILDFSSIEKGALAILPAPFAIADLVESVQAIRQSAAEKNLKFRCEVAADAPAQIAGDERRIRQILINLLGNAVKFTASGSVVLRIAPAMEGFRRRLDFSVEDTGPGIPSESLERLFLPFTQADSTRSRSFGGAGLGLAISQRLAEAMGGSITVASTPGQGSTFIFRLPLKSPAEEMIVPPLGQDQPGASAPLRGSGLFPLGQEEASGGTPLPPDRLVLVVEDDRISSNLAGKMLQSLGYRTEFAADGTQAVAAFAPGKYFAILMDIRMPVMNGIETTAQIRALESGSRVPIIALTANVMPGDRELYIAGGMDDFLSKPFKREDLATKLELFL